MLEDRSCICAAEHEWQTLEVIDFIAEDEVFNAPRPLRRELAVLLDLNSAKMVQDFGMLLFFTITDS
jgi:hypothetical protein